MGKGGKKKGDAAARRRAKKASVQARTGKPAPGLADRRGPGVLPFLMAPLDKDATRRFTLALEGDSPSAPLTLVELYFCVPDGLWRVQGSAPTPRATYLQWAKDMARTRGQLGAPERLRVPRALLDRKLWEAHTLFRADRYGREVDQALLARIPAPRTPPRHPAEDLDLGPGPILDVPTLGQLRHRLRPFIHRLPEEQLRSQVRRFGGTAAISVGSTDHETAMSMLAQQTRDWIRQWGLDEIRELLLDGTSWFHANRDPEAARTFQTLALSETFERDVVTFLTAFVRHHFK